MTIKIDGNRAAPDPDALQRADAVRGSHRASADQAAVPGDRVEVSRDARLVTAALRAASEAPAVRADVVERMRGLLDSRRLGADTARLADALIDRFQEK